MRGEGIFDLGGTMNKQELARLEMLNQIKLDNAQKDDVLSFFAKREEDLAILDKIEALQTEAMVYVTAGTIALREDIPTQAFDREQLQAQAPETERGYFCVPRVID